MHTTSSSRAPCVAHTGILYAGDSHGGDEASNVGAHNGANVFIRTRPSPHGQVHLGRCSGEDPAQTWAVDKETSTVRYTVAGNADATRPDKLGTSFCLALEGGNAVDGGVISLQECSGDASQEWAARPHTVALPTPRAPHASSVHC